VDSSPSP